MSDHSFELKGSLFPLSVMYCQDLSATSVKSQLQQKLAQAPAFFYRAPVVINVESVTEVPDFESIAQVFKELDLVLVGVCGASAELKKAAQACGLASLQLSKSKTASKGTKETKTEAVVAAPVMETKVIEQNIRSGQQIYAKGADLVIRGTVGAGAEVIADGNIHIYGTLRGKAIAGAAGDSQKRVFCHKLEAELISIAGSYWLSDSLQGEYWGKSACIGLQDDKLVLADLL